MKKIEGEEYKQLLLDMLDAFAQVCEENNLRYILDYGTLLGAIRHGGIIPWDDDIDVSMPREDYEKLYQLAGEHKNLFGEHYALATYRREPNVQKPYFNLIDTRTISVPTKRRKRYYHPLWIDITPLDYLPDNPLLARLDKMLCLRLMRMTRASLIRLKGKHHLIRFVRQKVLEVFRQPNMRLCDYIARTHRETDVLTDYYSLHGMDNIAYMSDFDDYIYHEFEHRYRFRIPRDYGKRLTALYGDYMQLPPEDKRIPHVTKTYWVD